MSTSRPKGFTDEQWEEIKRQRAADRAIDAQLRKAVRLVVERHGVSYGKDYIRGMLDEIWAQYPAPAAGYVKAAISKSLRKKVFQRDGYRCVRCGDWHNLEPDHIIPEVRGGATSFENLQTLCRTCNRSKGART